jgi:hypothetical protein
LETDVHKAGGAQRERLAHIDFRLYFLGEVSRADISGRFDVAPAVATRDLARYRALAPDNIRFDGSSKTYRTTNDFRPLFEHSLDRALSALSKGFGDGLGGAASGLVPCEYPAPIRADRSSRRGAALRLRKVRSQTARSQRSFLPECQGQGRERRYSR